MDFIVNTVSDSLGKKVNYHLNLDVNLQKLKRKYEELNSRKEDVEWRIKLELQSGKRLKKEVELWLANVRRISDKKASIKKASIEEVGEGNYFTRARVGEVIDEMIKEVDELYLKGSFSDSLVLDAPPRNGEIFSTTKLVGETTAIRSMETIWDLLMHDETRLIGVFGMGGVGKTTVMQHINNRLLEQTDKFDIVIWVTVSKVDNVFQLQDCVASIFKVNLSKCEDETIRAANLFIELREKKKYVLILDDVWEAFELENVGIPTPTSANGCKIVLTTRSLDVCRQMECRSIKMELLSKGEAWNLFWDKVKVGFYGWRINPRLEEIMKLVAQECACLPLAIIMIAGSMKGEVDEDEWSTALEELRGATWGLIGMKKVLEQLKCSYFRLKDEKLQQCLLYCALYPEDFEIERNELILRLIDEKIIEGRTRQAEFKKGHSILNRLENSCLLERVTLDYNSRYVKMHDLIRDMALQIMNPRCMVEAGVQLRNLPDRKRWTRDLKTVCLMNNNISKIHHGAYPRCQGLSTLLLLGNGGLREIPNSFFSLMYGLRVLDLSHTGIEILPNRISDLKNLTTLLLRWCYNLKYVPSLAKLKVLKRLDLSGSGIEEVPEGMTNLIDLKYLNLNAEYLRTLPEGILSKLSGLQYLIVWWGSQTLKIKAKEVMELEKLETFAGQFHDLNDYNRYVKNFNGFEGNEGRPNQYLLQVRPRAMFLDFNEEGSYFSKYVGLADCCISGKGRDALLLPGSIKELEIVLCHDARSLCDVSFMHESTSLKYCRIFQCDGIECLFSCSSLFCIISQRLEVVQLEELQNLHILYHWTTLPPSNFKVFLYLRELHIFKCPKIRNLFTPTSLSNLENLEEIHVKNCSGMEEITAANGQGEDTQQQGTGESSSHSTVNNDGTIITLKLPKLRRLTLEDLPELKSIVCSRTVMVCDSLQILIILSCPKIKRVPIFLPMLYGELCPPSSLLQIEINDREWWDSLEWDLSSAQDVLEPFLLLLDGRGQPVQ